MSTIGCWKRLMALLPLFLHDPAVAQTPLAGCWDGLFGAGAQKRRVMLEVDPESARWHGLARAISTDSVSGVQVDRDSVRFSIASARGPARFRGALVDGGKRLNGIIENAAGATTPAELRAIDDDGADGHALHGNWFGALQGGAYRVVMKLQPAPCGRTFITLDSPDQGVENLPVASVHITKDSLRIEMPVLRARYAARIASDRSRIEGVWEQSDVALPLTFARTALPGPNRPQHPAPPYPYTEEEVTVEDTSRGLRLAGTLTLPPGEDRVGAVLLLSGSGPQDRDEFFMGHRPFLVIADHLTRRGVAVLRMDDRGVGGSNGNHVASSTLDDMAMDAAAALDVLSRHPRIDSKRIGLLGHSEGGMTALLAAERNPDLAFLVMLGAPALSGRENLHVQRAAFMRAEGSTDLDIALDRASMDLIFDIIQREQDPGRVRAAVRDSIDAWLGRLPEEHRRIAASDTSLASGAQVAERLHVTLTPWFRSFLGFDPAPRFAKLRAPILAFLGERDLQVPAAPHRAGYEAAKRARADITIVEWPGLNHLFQHAEHGTIDEYERIEETISEDVLRAIGDWIVAQAAAKEGR